MTSLDAAADAMSSLTAALKILEDDMLNGIVDPDDAEALAAQINAQASDVAKAIAAARYARGK